VQHPRIDHAISIPKDISDSAVPRGLPRPGCNLRLGPGWQGSSHPLVTPTTLPKPHTRRCSRSPLYQAQPEVESSLFDLDWLIPHATGCVDAPSRRSVPASIRYPSVECQCVRGCALSVVVLLRGVAARLSNRALPLSPSQSVCSASGVNFGPPSIRR
jgi:hypothetical protein